MAAPRKASLGPLRLVLARTARPSLHHRPPSRTLSPTFGLGLTSGLGTAVTSNTFFPFRAGEGRSSPTGGRLGWHTARTACSALGTRNQSTQTIDPEACCLLALCWRVSDTLPSLFHPEQARAGGKTLAFRLAGLPAEPGERVSVPRTTADFRPSPLATTTAAERQRAPPGTARRTPCDARTTRSRTLLTAHASPRSRTTSATPMRSARPVSPSRSSAAGSLAAERSPLSSGSRPESSRAAEQRCAVQHEGLTPSGQQHA